MHAVHRTWRRPGATPCADRQISLFGDGAFMVAVAWAAYQISDAPGALAMVGLATSLRQVACSYWAARSATRAAGRRATASIRSEL
jgi:hypothetical protein